jgi:hypothetical protein
VENTVANKPLEISKKPAIGENITVAKKPSLCENLTVEEKPTTDKKSVLIENKPTTLQIPTLAISVSLRVAGKRIDLYLDYERRLKKCTPAPLDRNWSGMRMALEDCLNDMVSPG